MSRRWATGLLALSAVVALACGPGSGGSDEPPTGDLPASMGAIGDSLSVAWASCLAPTACPRNSWSTGDGTQVNTHYKRILAANPAIRGHHANWARAGVTTADLRRQANLAAQAKVQYLTFQIGANDACRRTIGEMTGTATFRAAVDEALGIIKRASPETRVLVVTIPDIYRLWEIGHTNRAATSTWRRGTCPALLANATSTAPADNVRRQQFRERIGEYNRELLRACREYGDRCKSDGSAVFDYRFELAKLSAVDFFHPNAAGQNDLARLTFPTRFGW
jgi:lysophospholipase L1-like esterase